MAKRLNILMVAAENDALPGGKVGGIGDVVRDAPQALADAGCSVHVVIPAYGRLARVEGAKKVTTMPVTFGGIGMGAEVYVVPGKSPNDDVIHWVVDHPAFSPRGDGQIYCDDGPDAPFSTDAGKFAMFCQLVANLIRQELFGDLDVIHLHDWHAAALLLLRHYHPDYEFLQDTHCVFSIHNLALQGIRPLRNDWSSLDAWFPGLRIDGAVTDPRWPECINLMRAGINLADKIHVVSPSYAREILEPSDVLGRGYYGGEGLEYDLRRATDDGRLFGILNGCDYPAEVQVKRLQRRQLAVLIKEQLWRWIAAEPQLAAVNFIAEKRNEQLAARRDQVLITSVGRITSQKVRLLQQTTADGKTALHALLERLGSKGTYLFLGSGEGRLEQFLTNTAAQYDNFVFLRGYSDSVADALYHSGHLFLMPSSFEPCGIGQMLAMRGGQPCLVHRVGGLNDTVQDGVNGFSFAGDSPQQQAGQLVERFAAALQLRQRKPQEWKKIVDAAAASRFSWKSSIEKYQADLYS